MKGRREMGASKKIKKILIDKNINQKMFAEELGKDYQQVQNALFRDTFNCRILEEWLDVLGCDMVFRDRETGKIYD